MKNNRGQCILFAVLCVMMPIFSMDKGLQAAHVQLQAVGANVNSIARASAKHKDLFDAAQTVPQEFNEQHLCIKVLNDAYFLFWGEHKLYEKGNNSFPAEPEALVNTGERACEGARYLILEMTHKIKKDTTRHDDEKKKITEGMQEEIKKLKSDWAVIVQDKDDLIVKVKEEQKKAQEHLKEKIVEDKRKEALLKKADTAVENLTIQNKRQRIALAACVISFLGYFVWVQWNSH